MRLGVVGSGGVGSALAGLLARRGRDVVFVSRDPDRARQSAARLGAAGAIPYAAAAADCEVLFFCVPFEHSAQALEMLGDLQGRILVDVSNPEGADGRSLAVGHTISGAEIIAQRARSALVVKAFNYVYAELLSDDGALAQLRPSIFLCGNEARANAQIANLIAACGLTAVDCGPLASARYLEPLALLMVQLVRSQGWGPADCAMRLATRAPVGAAHPA